MRTIKESLAALHIQDYIKQTKTTGIDKKDDWTKTRCARPSLTGVGHRDLGWTLLGQGLFGTAELRHPSCANLGTCILRFAGFYYRYENWGSS